MPDKILTHEPNAFGGRSQRWQASRLLSAPHRLAFFLAALLMAGVALWWSVVLYSRALGWILPWAVPPTVAHGLLMTCAFMPLFMVGFLFTAGPNWLGVPKVAASSLLRPLLLISAGWVLAAAGFHFAMLLAAIGVGLACLGWSVLLWRFGRLIAASAVPDRLHVRAVHGVGWIGAAALAIAALALSIEAAELARAATQIALWAWVAATFAIVSHRMLPFFTASALPSVEARRPNSLLGAMLLTLVLSALSQAAALLWWPLPAALHAAMAGLQAAAAALLSWLSLRWGLWPSRHNRLLAMLHGGFVWLGIALALAALSHARVAWFGESAALGLAPLHALTMGYLGATLMAMITRVTAGHSGRSLVADNLAWVLYLTLQLAALLRVTAALRPALSQALTLAAALAWTLACGGWAWRYGGWLGRPRADGRAG
jgi:uncharacterized protein involved in response to NO